MSRQKSVGASVVLVSMLSIGAAPGCMTVLEGRRIRGGVSEVRARLEARREVEREHARQLAELSRAFADTQAGWGAGGRGTLVAAARMESDIATLATRIDHLADQAGRLSREREEERRRLEGRLVALEQSDTGLAEKAGLSIPDDKEELLRQATSLLASGSGDQARRYYRTFIDRFPGDSRAPQAYLALGRSYAEEARYSNAATAYQGLISHYPTAPEVPEALWQLSRSFERLSFCTDARALLRSLLDRFPHSPEAAPALKELEHLKRPLPAADCVS